MEDFCALRDGELLLDDDLSPFLNFCFAFEKRRGKADFHE